MFKISRTFRRAFLDLFPVSRELPSAALFVANICEFVYFFYGKKILLLFVFDTVCFWSDDCFLWCRKICWLKSGTCLYRSCRYGCFLTELSLTCSLSLSCCCGDRDPRRLFFSHPALEASDKYFFGTSFRYPRDSFCGHGTINFGRTALSRGFWKCGWIYEFLVGYRLTSYLCYRIFGYGGRLSDRSSSSPSS